MTFSTFARAKRVALAVMLPALLAACGGSPTDVSAAATDLSTTSPSADLASAPIDTAGSRSSAPSVSPPSAPSSPASPSSSGPPAGYHGVNLSGAEFGSALPGTDGRDYTFPTTSEVDYYLAKGMNTFRVPFMWERVQRAAYGSFDAVYTGKLEALVTYATSRGAHVVLNPQNFARYYGSVIGSPQVPNAVFADFWKKMATRFAANANVMFNLVNEPHDLPTEQWVAAANAAILAIRSAGATPTIIAPGNGWTGAHSWSSSDYGTPNAVAMLNLVDPQGDLLFEVHQYLDADSSGSGAECVSATIGSERLAGFVKWLRDHGRKGFVGELAGARTPTCYAAVTDMLKAMTRDRDVLVGWLWWGGGPWWGEYPFTLEPKSGQDRPQMALLTPYL